MSTQWSKQEILDAIQSCAQETFTDQSERGGLRTRDYGIWSLEKEAPQLLDVYDEFGTWRQACAVDLRSPEQANSLRVKRSDQKDEDVRTALRRARKSWGDKPMGKSDYSYLADNRVGITVSLRSVLINYERWSIATSANGIVPARVWKLAEHAESEWMDLVRKVCEEHGGPMSVRQFNSKRDPGTPTANKLARKYGGWNAVLIGAGFKQDEISGARELRLPPQLVPTSFTGQMQPLAA